MRKQTIGKLAGLIAAAATVVSANAAMEVYTGTVPLLNSATDPTTIGVVGTIWGTTGQGQGGWDAAGNFQKTAAQALLNLALGGSGSSLGEALYANTGYDYFGTVSTSSALGSSLSGGSANTTIPSGWNFAIAKYAGQNAGYVLFYLGGNSATLPVAPANYWTTDPNQWEISGWTAFNAVPEPTTMIAGALLLLPFAASTIRFFRKHRAA